jgi:hypothetical protein
VYLNINNFGEKLRLPSQASGAVQSYKKEYYSMRLTALNRKPNVVANIIGV